jgi:hypothetical protein
MSDPWKLVALKQSVVCWLTLRALYAFTTRPLLLQLMIDLPRVLSTADLVPVPVLFSCFKAV